ncbi:MAG: hypothetical protein ABSD27_00390 [Bryobacteraceae bacterium]|jgi:hypothetical protein
MPPHRSVPFLLLPVAAFLCGCGYVGDPHPPSLNIPERIADLSAGERGDKLIIDFTPPAATTDGVGLKRLRSIDLRAGPEGPNWEASARRLETGAAKPGPIHLEIPAREWVGQQIVIRARAQAPKGRFGEWSNAARLKVLPPLERPAPDAQAAPDGVRLRWNGPQGAQYRIYRRAPGEQKSQLAGTVGTPEYTDLQARYDATYVYTVQAFVPSGDGEAQSEMSQPVEITPQDTFAPAVPSGLSAVAGVGAILLNWEPDPEPDLRGYYVYRSADGQPPARLGELATTPAYSDSAVQSGKRYRYEVTAVDQKGNESARSAPVEATAP